MIDRPQQHEKQSASQPLLHEELGYSEKALGDSKMPQTGQRLVTNSELNDDNNNKANKPSHTMQQRRSVLNKAVSQDDDYEPKKATFNNSKVEQE